MHAAERSLSLAEVDYVTRNLHNLQGLRLLPLIPALALWAGSESGLLRGDWWLWAWLASLLVAVVGVPAIGAWYRARFGSVRKVWDERRARQVSAAVLGLVVLWAAMFTLGVTGLLPDVAPVSITGAALGAAFAGTGVAAGRIGRRVHPWTHRAGAAVLLAGLVPLGLLERFGGVHPLNADGAVSFLLAVLLLIGAVDTHRALTRLLPATDAATDGA